MKINTFIKNNDFLGENIIFTINSFYSFKTVMGGFLSIIIMIFYVIFFFIFGLDLIFKKNPNSSSQTRVPINMTFPKLNLSQANFLFGIRGEDYDGKIYNLTNLFHSEIILYEYTFNSSSGVFRANFNKFEVIPCNFSNTSYMDTGIYKLNEWYCPNMTNFKGRDLFGDWNEKSFSFIKFKLKICSDSEMKNCKNMTKIMETFDKGIAIQAIYQKVNFNSDDYMNPFLINLENFYAILDVKTLRNDYLYLITHLLEDDTGFLFENKFEKNDYGGFYIDGKNFARKSNLNNNYLNESKNINDSNNDIYTFSVYFHKNVSYYTRKYMKFQELVANVSGFMDLMIFFIGFFYRFYNNFRLNSYLFNRLVIFENNLNNIKSDSEKPTGFTKSKYLEKNQKNLVNIKENEISNSRLIKNKKMNEEIRIHNNIYELKFFSNIENDTNRKNNLYSNKIFDISNDNFHKNKGKNAHKQISNERFNIIYNGFYSYKNHINFGFFSYLFNLSFQKKSKDRLNLNKILNNFTKKIYLKLDILYYFRFLKKNKIIKKILFNENHVNILKILSKKTYKIEETYNLTKNKKLNQENFHQTARDYLLNENDMFLDNTIIDDKIKEMYFG